MLKSSGADKKKMWQKQSSSYGMFERCSVADGGKMLLKFLEPGFLKRCRAEPEKSWVSACSSCPAPPRGSCTTGCLDNITRITLPCRRWPFRWLIAVKNKKKLQWNLKNLFGEGRTRWPREQLAHQTGLLSLKHKKITSFVLQMIFRLYRGSSGTLGVKWE